MKKVPLRETVDFIRDGTHGSPVRTETGVPVLSAMHVKAGRLSFDTERFTSEDEYQTFSRRVPLAVGDVLVTIVGTIGRAAIINQVLPLVFQRSVAIIRPKSNVLSSRFLYHASQSSDFQRQLNRATNKSSQAGVYLGKLGEILIPLPSLAEQHRIAAILDVADFLRTKRQEAIAQLDKLAQAIFIEMFGDPVTNSKGLPLRKLGDIGTLERGISKHRPRNDPALLGGRYPLIQTGDVAQSGGYITTYTQSYSELGLKQSRLWPKGTLCITIAANIAKTGILEFDACFPDSIVGFSAREQETVIYVKAWMGFLQKTIERNAPESAQKNINLEILRNLDVPSPSIEAQKKFADRVAKINSQKRLFESAESETNRFFNSLQNKAFSAEF